MTHPKWVLKLKTKRIELRNIGGRFYLYRISSKYDKERNTNYASSQNITRKLLEITN
ncbi:MULTISPECIES: hypothetical protein [unclassified Candidatus Tisiphia]|uniref:hypothetical protein n=1 Tax=unclassified Candidatus Tisiphia TaxID=2996318 RepID=UPI00312C873D